MSDLRARLADALQEHIPAVVTLPGYLDVAGMGVHGCDCGDKSAGVDWVYHLADVLLSLDGIAIVELPKQPSVAAIQAVVNKYDPEWAARFAADLLAAANTAEEGP